MCRVGEELGNNVSCWEASVGPSCKVIEVLCRNNGNSHGKEHGNLMESGFI